MRNTIPGQYNVTVKTVLMWMPLWGYFHFLTDLSGDPDQFASNADFSYVSGKRHKGDLLLKWRNCVTLHLSEICGFYFMLTVIQIAFTSVPGKCLSHFLTLLLYRVISKLINYWWWFKFTCQGTLLLRYHWARL